MNKIKVDWIINPNILDCRIANSVGRGDNLDTNSSPIGGSPYNDDNTMHEAAVAVAQKDLNKTVR